MNKANGPAVTHPGNRGRKRRERPGNVRESIMIDR
jgi:hypothetical protein